MPEEYITMDVYSCYTSTEEFSIATTYKGTLNNRDSMLQITEEFSVMLQQQSTIVIP